jgi:hypothetical protein
MNAEFVATTDAATLAAAYDAGLPRKALARLLLTVLAKAYLMFWSQRVGLNRINFSHLVMPSGRTPMTSFMLHLVNGELADTLLNRDDVARIAAVIGLAMDKVVEGDVPLQMPARKVVVADLQRIAQSANTYQLKAWATQRATAIQRGGDILVDLQIPVVTK